jgi:hypothetical protein
MSISIASDNLPSVVKSHFIQDSSNAQLIRYFGNELRGVIHRHIQILCSESFSLSFVPFGIEEYRGGHLRSGRSVPDCCAKDHLVHCR